MHNSVLFFQLLHQLLVLRNHFGGMPSDKLSQRAVVQSETAGNGFNGPLGRFIHVQGFLVSFHASVRYQFAILRFFIPRVACSCGSCSFRYSLKQSASTPNSAATFAVVSPPSFNRAMAAEYLIAVSGLYRRKDDQSTCMPSS